MALTKTRTFRFIPYAQGDAAWNMAVDEALLDAHVAGDSPPVLRIYGFKPAAVTIGHNQAPTDILIEECAKHGFDVARRPTGGRAVLHLDDLTYSFIGTSLEDNERGFLSRSVTGAYREICQGLIGGLRKLGADLAYGKSDVPYRHLHDCFAATTGSDLQFNGRKMVGSAQLRRHQGVLQHGSILLNQDQLMAGRLFGKAEESGPDSVRHANLYEALGRPVEINELSEALLLGFSEAFAAEFVSRPLMDSEIAQAGSLIARNLINQPG